MAKKKIRSGLDEVDAMLSEHGLSYTIHTPPPLVKARAPKPVAPEPEPKKKLTKPATRIPPEVDGIQVNFCKNPLCRNFGVPALDKRPSKASKGMPGDAYRLSGAGSGTPVLVCKVCGEFPPIKSNQGIVEELERLCAYLLFEEPCCPNEKCANHTVPLSSGTNNYYKVGYTPAGSERYKCRDCGKTWSIGKPALRQKIPHKNRDIFKDLVAKKALRRLCEAREISLGSIYAKIDFIYRQCLAFIADRERRLMQGMALKTLYISVDRQDYAVNWTEQEDKRNIMLHAVGSAELETGYIFGMHLNYDPELDSKAMEADAVAKGDYDLSSPYRRYARLWLKQDYAQSVKRSAKRRVKRKGGVALDIEQEYADGDTREDIEASNEKTLEEKLPPRGMQVHAEYTLYGHFLFLRKLLPGAEKYRFFLDQDSGMRAACLAAFHREIKARICDAFFVRINKDMTEPQKKSAVGKATKAFNKACELSPGKGGPEVLNELMQAEIERSGSYGKWEDKWAFHPLPTMNEPEKAMCYLTDLGGLNAVHEEGLSEEEIKKLEQEHKAGLFLKASLHAIDNYFQQVRRRIMMLERPIGSASETGRRWYGYASYQPEVIVKLLTIHRVYLNYCKASDKDKKTPAMRLGLAKTVIDPQKILYFR